jgi:SAM-dependent methyltransferase
MSDLQQAVKEKYGAIAASVTSKSTNPGCCGPALSERKDQTRVEGCGCGDPISSNLYSDAETTGLPADAVTASLGCGNPTALLALEPGQTVLDLGSGGGIDVLLSARRVGPAGKVYGLDMTDEMLALARENQRKSGATNVEFLKGTIEAIPLPANSVDVIISNCVINLSSDKDAVLREAFRVLKPGGRFAVSDVVVRGDVPADVRRNVELWVGCIAGALRDTEYSDKLRAAGFADIEVEPWRVYKIDDARAFLTEAGVDVDRIAPLVEDSFASAFIRARKPEAKSCCGPECCA